jgi:nitroimidazol reductase NimA-like FMN-containing flavoprotein (pyridoxamine 5'-phosphate oxidase superfamily)
MVAGDAWEAIVSLAMTKQERERFLADLHVGIISIPEEGRGPLTVPIWYSYEPAASCES